MCTMTNPTYVSASDSGSEQDFEYGPGIVEKLRAKFQRLTATVSSEAKVSQHKAGKRCSSVGDILATTEEILRKYPITNGQPPSLLSQFSRLQSRSTGHMIDTNVSCRPFTLHRTVKTEEPNDIRGATISALQRKFGAPVQRESPFSAKHAKGQASTHPELHSVPCESIIKFTSGRDLARRGSGEHNAFANIITLPHEDGRQEQRVIGSSSTTWRTFGARNNTLVAESNLKPLQVLEVLNHAGAAEVANNNEDVEPEFIKVGRRLRKSSTLLRKGEEGDTRNTPEKTLYHSELRSPKTCRAFSSSFVEIPTFSSNARVVSDDFCEETEPPCLENSSPPDPDSARKRVSHTSDTKPAFSICTDDIFTTINSSPPPEEPTPSLDVNEYISGAYAKEIRTPIPRNLHDNDKGEIEMQRLLRKFQRSRSERQQEAKASMTASELPSNLPPAVPKDQAYVHAILGRLSGLSASSTMKPINGSMALANPNVVHITVRSDSSTLSAKQSSCGGIVPLPPSLLPPELRPPTEGGARKILSPKYEERRDFVSPILQGNDSTFETTEQQSDSRCVSHGVSNSELPQTVLHNPIHLDGQPSTGDANPVHHSLLSLVMEEDIPALMEAMNETFTCEFEDLSEQSSSTSSILYTPERRKERRKAREVSSIRFEEANPKVYTYLDEISAIVKKEWVEGVHVDYETYRRIVAAEVEEYKSVITGLQNWNEEINTRATESGTSHKGNKFSVVVTSGLPYPLLPESNTMCV